MQTGAKRARAAEPQAPGSRAANKSAACQIRDITCDKRGKSAEPSAGRPQLLLVKSELQSWLGKKFCDEEELLPLLLGSGIARRVRTIAVGVRPLGGDSFKVVLDAKRPLVSEVKAEIARLQGTRERKQELYKVATRADGGAVREDDAEPEALDDDDTELRDGEIVAMAVKESSFEPLHAQEERVLEGHTGGVECLVVHGDKLLSASEDYTIKVWNTETWTCERTLEGHTNGVSALVVHGDKLLSVLPITQSTYGTLSPGHVSAPLQATLLL
jgi:hypothetical protein